MMQLVAVQHLVEMQAVVNRCSDDLAGIGDRAQKRDVGQRLGGRGLRHLLHDGTQVREMGHELVTMGEGVTVVRQAF
uniref:hypothetical protein n=1 Tax=Neorhizobium sp. EC2-8 TaxID=3129230 RepID=UPI003101A29C